MDRPELDPSIARIEVRKSRTLLSVERAPRKLEDAPNLIYDLVSYMLIEHLIANPIFVLHAIQLYDRHIIFLCRIHPPPFAAPLRLRVRNLPDLDHTRRGIHLAPDHQTFLVCSLVRQG